MNRLSKLPARFLLVLLSTILIAAGMTSVVLASRTYYYGDYFAVVEAESNYAWFSIDQFCDDIDENCAVKVEGTPGGSGNDYTQRWVDELSRDATRTFCGFSANEYGDDQMYADFENCWEQQKSGFTVLWPVIHHNDDFEITPHCKRGDDVCAVELRICFNAADCENNKFRRRDWSQVGGLWDEFLGVFDPWCLYEDDEDELWECIDDEFQDWLTDYLDRNDDYDDLEDVEEEERGFTLEDYENHLNDVGGDRPSTRRSETALEPSRQQGTSRTATPIYQPVDNAYLTVNFTAYLETNAPYRICNTTIGCITVATLSNTFRSHMQNLHIVIQNPDVLSCMGRTGWDVGNNHAIPFDNASLIACDARIRTANQVCPAKDTGASGDLFTMWDTGLLRGILFDTEAQAHRLQVERARNRTPKCLCTAGFLESNFVVTANETAGPWERSRGLRTEDVCN